MIENAIAICDAGKSKILRTDKLLNAKAHILHQIGKDNKARDILRFLGKNRDIYSQLYESCIEYEALIKRQVDMVVLKEFIRPKR